MAMTLDYGEEEDRPAYVGLSNTMIAPATILAPIVGGWLADFGGYQLTFLVSAILSLATAGIILAFVRDPHARVRGLA